MWTQPSLLIAWLSVAVAAPTGELPFTSPTSTHLFSRVGMVESKASEPGDSCDAAMNGAMAQLMSRAAKDGVPTLVSVVIKGADGEACAQRRTGDTVLQSVVVLEGMGIAEEPSLPSMSVTRVVTIAATLGAATSGMGNVRIEPHSGAAWWAMPDEPMVEGQPASGQAAAMLLKHMLPALTAKGSALSSLPEVAGVVQTFQAGKKKSAQGLRLFVPSRLVSAFVRGNATDDDVLQGARVETREGEGPWTLVSEGSLELGDAAGVQVQLREVDMDDADIEGLEDEE